MALNMPNRPSKCANRVCGASQVARMGSSLQLHNFTGHLGDETMVSWIELEWTELNWTVLKWSEFNTLIWLEYMLSDMLFWTVNYIRCYWKFLAKPLVCCCSVVPVLEALLQLLIRHHETDQIASTWSHNVILYASRCNMRQMSQSVLSKYPNC